jgi:hypothetical protein
MRMPMRSATPNLKNRYGSCCMSIRFLSVLRMNYSTVYIEIVAVGGQIS